MLKSIQQSLLLALCASAPAMASAAPLSEDEARNVAAEFFQSGDVSRLGNAEAFTLAFTAKDAQSRPVSYVFNAKDGQGFIIVSAESEALPVIGYSDSATWQPDLRPGAAVEMISVPVEGESGARTGIFRAARAADQGPVLLPTPSWSQESPFNNNIPNRRLTGCVGVALAEIMKYHEYPAMRPASLITSGGDPAYAWSAMRDDNYRSGYTDTEAQAVADLVADAAIAIGTDFGLSSSSAFEVRVPYALSSTFGYDAGVSYKKRSELDKNAWDALIVNELNEGRPVLYSGQDVSSGHAFVCDGYEMRGDTPYFHINWGWGGSANGYFASDALNPVVSKAHSYNDLMTVVYNIRPATTALEWSAIHITSDEAQPGLTLDTDDITSATRFTVRAGALKNIGDTDFNGQLAVALYGADGKQKCLLSDPRTLKLVSLQTSRYTDFTCALPAGTDVADSDVVRLATRLGDGVWLPVAGDGRLAPGEMPAKGATLGYFSIDVPAQAEAVDITPGEGRVIKGRDYTFKVVPTSADKVITVKANGFILTPDAAHNYRLTNVLADQKITINVQNAADVLSKSVLWVQAGQLSTLLDDNATSTVNDLTLFGTINADDFAFIRERMKLQRLDISQATITALGSNPANALPTKALMGYRSLQSILLPANLTTFKNGCLAQTGLRSIDIPASVATFEYNVFVGCNQLREVIYRRSAPAWVNWCVFSGVPQDRLIVPVGATAAYQAKEYWQDFKEIQEGVPALPTAFGVTVAEKKGLRFTLLTEGSEFSKGSAYEFKLDTDNTYDDAVMTVYANSTRLTPDAGGVYKATINGNTLIHAEFKQPQATTVDERWKLTGDEGGIGLVTSVVNVPFGQNFTVRANAIKVPAGDHAVKVYAIALTNKEGGIKEFVSPQVQNYSGAGGNLCYSFTCQVKEAPIRGEDQLRLVTSYDKKTWQVVTAEADSITDRLEAIGNPVQYHKVTMPASVTGATLQGATSEVVRGMPFTMKASAISPAQRVTVAVNGKPMATRVTTANITIPAVTEDLDITIAVNDADAGDFMVFNVDQGQLASKLADCPARVKLVGSMNVGDYDAIRANAAKIVDLDMSEVTVKGAMLTGNTIPENAFTPKEASTISALRTVTLPGNIERISKNAFARCVQLTEVTIPAKVEYIGDAAFASCVKLEKITSNPKTAPTCGSSSPFPSSPSKITLHVPKGSEESYSVKSTWWSLLTMFDATNVKTNYWVKVDPTRVAAFGNNVDLNRIQVGNAAVSQILTLPNNQSTQWGGAEVMRAGTIFKLYDNGIDVFNNLSTYVDGQCTPEQSWSMVGGRLMLKWNPAATSGPWVPQNHVIDVVFYYQLTFEPQASAKGATATITEVPENSTLTNIAMARYQYADGRMMNTKVVPIAYREGSEIKFTLSEPPRNTEYVVSAVTKLLTKPGKTPEYEERTVELTPDGGVYTTPALEGDVRIVISGISRYEEGDPIPANDLAVVKKEHVEEFTQLTVTGEMGASDFEQIRDKFEALENLDLSQIGNEVIPADAFAGMDHLKTITVPATVTEIGEGAFKNCDGIETLTLPGVNSIGEGAFEGCSNLTSILIPAADSATPPASADRPMNRIARSGSGISAESFRGLNPNCLIYIGGNEIPDSDNLNIILNKDGKRVAASDIILDGAHSFNAPASFGLGSHRISFTTDIPASIGSDDNDGWKGLILPFTPTAMEYGVEFAQRPGSGLHLMAFESDGDEMMTPQMRIEANKPYLAHVSAPYETVPVTFYATTASTADEFVYDVPFTPVPEEAVSAGKSHSLYGSFDGETTLGVDYRLNDNADHFIPAEADDHVAVGNFAAYLRSNAGEAANDFFIGEHPLWICDPATTYENDSKLYRTQKVALSSDSPLASIYYTLDGSDPAADGILYEEPIAIDGDAMALKAIAKYKENLSDPVAFDFLLKKMALDFDLPQHWSWISHTLETPVAVADFATEGVSRVLAQDEEAVRDPKYGFVGTLAALEPGAGYKVCVDAEGWKGTLAGAAHDPSAEVELRKGWNWLGCPVDADASLQLADLFAGLKADEGDMLVGQEGFAQVNAQGEWTGTLDAMKHGAAYMYYSVAPKNFAYTIVASEAKAEAKAAREQAAPAAAPWAVDIHRYAGVMPMTAIVADMPAHEERVVAAFCGDECRGIGVEKDGAVMINIHGQRGDMISFRFLAPDGTQRQSVKAIDFEEMPVGNLAAPYELLLDATTAVAAVEADGFALTGADGSLILKGDLSKILSVEVYDLDGTKLADCGNAAKTGTITIGDLTPGVHIILVRTTDGCLYRKALVK